MKVWLVFKEVPDTWGDGDHMEFVVACATKEIARAYVAEHCNEWGYPEWEIDEVTVRETTGVQAD